MTGGHRTAHYVIIMSGVRERARNNINNTVAGGPQDIAYYYYYYYHHHHHCMLYAVLIPRCRLLSIVITLVSGFRKSELCVEIHIRTDKKNERAVK